jgi:hypothetical protein
MESVEEDKTILEKRLESCNNTNTELITQMEKFKPSTHFPYYVFFAMRFSWVTEAWMERFTNTIF